MRRMYLTAAFVVVTLLGLPVDVLHATLVHPFEIFTSNGAYHDNSVLDLYVEVSNGDSQVDFTFYNESLIDSSIARIYFDDGSLLDIAMITEGPGTFFSQPAIPGNLPAGNLLEPPFVTAGKLCIGSNSPRPHDGINPGEWVQITFDLINGGILPDVIDKLNSGALRIGIHVIGLPDGSGESAITAPEPTTVCLMGLGGLALLRKRRD